MNEAKLKPTTEQEAIILAANSRDDLSIEALGPISINLTQ